MTPLYTRKRGEVETDEKTIGAVGEDGDNTNPRRDGGTVGNPRKCRREKIIQDKERLRSTGKIWTAILSKGVEAA